jgi:cytochrome oxidase Cu insertion factor (SCO1/SenC/PrrC family)
MRVDQVTGQLTVGQLATRTGVRADTVRYHEREGLLPVPQRTGGEHRRYGPADVDRGAVGEQATRGITGQALQRRFLTVAAAAAVLVIAASAVAVIAVRGHQRGSLARQRPSGIPASIPDRTINLMGLAPVPARPAPGFTLTDQDGRAVPLSGWRGKVVVLEFMDPHCTDTCPLVSQEFVDAYHDLGRAAPDVVFAAVNVNQYRNRVPDVLAYSRAHQLITIPGWHFLTGPAAALRAVWRAYNVEVQAPSPDADIVHTSAVYFIGPGGTERYVADPMVDHTAAARPIFRLARSPRGAAASLWSPGPSAPSSRRAGTPERSAPPVGGRRHHGPFGKDLNAERPGSSLAACGVKAASRVAVMSLAVSSGSSRSAAASPAATCMRLVMTHLGSYDFARAFTVGAVGAAVCLAIATVLVPAVLRRPTG